MGLSLAKKSFNCLYDGWLNALSIGEIFLADYQKIMKSKQNMKKKYL